MPITVEPTNQDIRIRYKLLKKEFISNAPVSILLTSFKSPKKLFIYVEISFTCSSLLLFIAITPIIIPIINTNETDKYSLKFL